MGRLCLNNILFFVSYTLCLNVVKLNTNIENEKPLRRQRKPPPMPRVPGMLVKTEKDNGYYEPYWNNGDWVFDRQTSTNRPKGHVLNIGSTQHGECDQICLKIYEEYGPVCGMRLTRDEWRYENRTFENICHLELANCVGDKKTWYPSRKGACKEGMTIHPKNSTAVLSRLTTWLKGYT